MSLGWVLLAAMLGSTGFQAEAGQQDVRPIADVRDVPKPLYTHVRSDNRYVIGLIRRGYDQSPTFRELVDTLQRSNAVVFVQPGLCAGGRIRSCLVAVTGSAHDRHIRIRLDPQHTIENGLIAAAAHELQHAVEVAENLEVVDPSSLKALYRRIAIGRCGEGLSEECETTRALTTERTVYLELQRGASDAVISQLRSIEPHVRQIIAEGQRRSPTFAALAERVEHSSTFVYVLRVYTLAHGMEGCLVLEGDGSTMRYLRILLVISLPRDRLIAVLAHELQHVSEVLEAGVGGDRTAMEALFRKIGYFRQGSDTAEEYETSAAERITDVVARELRGSKE